MPEGVIGRKEFEQTHRCIQIEQEGPGTTYVALARMTWHNGVNSCIVARVLFTRQSGLREWTVFFGSAPIGDTVLASAQEIVENGAEMSQSDGEHFFPRLDGTYYR